MAQAIQGHVKQTDTVGRRGGEEFGIVLPGATVKQTRGIVERIHSTLAELPLLDAQANAIARPTASQGIASLSPKVHTAAALVDCADRMLYEGKQRGRDPVLVAM